MESILLESIYNWLLPSKLYGGDVGIETESYVNKLLVESNSSPRMVPAMDNSIFYKFATLNQL